MSAKVIETTMNGRETLKLTSAQNVTALKDVENGTEIEYVGHCIQEIVNEKTGETFSSLLLKTADGSIVATRSDVFINSLHTIIETLNSFADPDDDEPVILRVVHAKSKKGNMFVTCELA